jgi:hypothetical protein
MLYFIISRGLFFGVGIVLNAIFIYREHGVLLFILIGIFNFSDT